MALKRVHNLRCVNVAAKFLAEGYLRRLDLSTRWKLFINLYRSVVLISGRFMTRSSRLRATFRRLTRLTIAGRERKDRRGELLRDRYLLFVYMYVCMYVCIHISNHDKKMLDFCIIHREFNLFPVSYFTRAQ